jgi:hypothetical protein
VLLELSQHSLHLGRHHLEAAPRVKVEETAVFVLRETPRETNLESVCPGGGVPIEHADPLTHCLVDALEVGLPRRAPTHSELGFGESWRPHHTHVRCTSESDFPGQCTSSAARLSSDVRARMASPACACELPVLVLREPGQTCVWGQGRYVDRTVRFKGNRAWACTHYSRGVHINLQQLLRVAHGVAYLRGPRRVSVPVTDEHSLRIVPRRPVTILPRAGAGGRTLDARTSCPKLSTSAFTSVSTTWCSLSISAATDAFAFSKAPFSDFHRGRVPATTVALHRARLTHTLRSKAQLAEMVLASSCTARSACTRLAPTCGVSTSGRAAGGAAAKRLCLARWKTVGSFTDIADGLVACRQTARARRGGVSASASANSGNSAEDASDNDTLFDTQQVRTPRSLVTRGGA